MKRFLFALLLTGIIFGIGYYRIHKNYRSSIDSGMIAVEKEMSEDGSLTNANPSVILFRKASAEFPDFICGMAFNKSGKPIGIGFGKYMAPQIKDFLQTNAELHSILDDFRKNPSKFLSARKTLSIKSPNLGTFTLRPLIINNEKALLVFSSGRIDKKTRIFLMLNIVLFILILIVSFRVRRKSAPVEKIRALPTVESLKENTVRKLFEEKKKLQKEIDDLSFFREIALATNTIADLKNMLDVILDLIAMKFPGRDIVICLGKDGSSEEFEPVCGILKNEKANAEELAAAGHSGISEDGLRQILNDQEQGHRYPAGTLLPLKDDENLLGFILFGDSEDGKPPDTADLNFTARQLSMAIRNSVLYNMAITDGLTGLYVQRYFQMKIDEEIRRSTRYRSPFTLAMLDLDHFKGVNDTHGHQAGDGILQGVAALIRMSVRKTDFIFRYGGEEIAVIMPETGLAEGLPVCEKIRKMVEDNNFEFNGQTIKITVSIGVASWTEGTNKKKLVEKCDAALYQAKEQGRNRIVTAGA